MSTPRGCLPGSQDGNLGGGGDGTETLVLGSAKPAALSQGGSSLQAQPSNGGSKGAAASGAAGAELDTVIIQPRPPRQGSGTGSLADAYTSNRTSHTFGSTSTGSGGESTAPLRMSTPRAGEVASLTEHGCYRLTMRSVYV